MVDWKHDWKAAITELESWLGTDLIETEHLNAAITACKEMQRREDKKTSIKEIMKS